MVIQQYAHWHCLGRQVTCSPESLQPLCGFTGSLDELKDELDEPLCFGAHPLMTFMTQAGKFLEQGVTAPDIHTETKRASWRALCLQHCC